MLNQIFNQKMHLVHAAMMQAINHPENNPRFIPPKKMYRGLTQGEMFFMIAGSLQEARFLALLSSCGVGISNELKGVGMRKELVMDFLQQPDVVQIDILNDMSMLYGENFIWGIKFFGDQNSNTPLSFPAAPEILFRSYDTEGVLYPSGNSTATITCPPAAVYEEAVTGDIATEFSKCSIQITAPVSAWATLPYQILGLMEAKDVPLFKSRSQPQKG